MKGANFARILQILGVLNLVLSILLFQNMGFDHIFVH